MLEVHLVIFDIAVTKAVVKFFQSTRGFQ